MSNALKPGDSVIRSPVGKGRITGFTEFGLPVVNGTPVEWLETLDRRQFDPNKKGPWHKPRPKFTVINGGKNG